MKNVTMKPQLISLFFATFYITIQVFFHSLQALVNSGSLIVKSGEFIEINTTVPSINYSSNANYNSTLQNRSSPAHGSHRFAHIEFSGNIEFRNGSTVKVFGKYALSITSQNGNISIHTDVNMTCGEKVFDTTCLGGFTQNSTEEEVVYDPTTTKLYQGLGPGGLPTINKEVDLSGLCKPGASHGGNGGRGQIHDEPISSPKPYDKNNTASLLGGSGGSCVENPGKFSGGGAIELVAESGAIIIGATIRAAAQNEGTGKCSGASGGLIRLNASKVTIRENGKLIVDGGRGQEDAFGGGAGGVIQIIAPEGEIAAGTLSLKGGDSSEGDCINEAEEGYFLLKANETAIIGNNHTKSYKWPSTPSLTSASSKRPTDKDVKDLLENLEGMTGSLPMPDLIANLQEVFMNMTKGNLPLGIGYTLETEKVLVVVKRNRTTADGEDIVIREYGVVKNVSWSNGTKILQIPKAAIQSAKENYTVVFLLYKDRDSGLPNFSQSETEEQWNVSSFVMSCYLALDDRPIYNLTSPANLFFKTPSAEGRSRRCSFWNTDESVWSTNGVKELKFNSSSSITVCQTEHFTSFAVLMQHTRVELSQEDHLALSIITYIGCGVSTGALIITIIVFLSVESLSSERHKIHTNLVVSLLLANVLFLAGINETSSPVLCKVVAVSMHYFFLSAFTWMLVEGLHLYLKVVQVFRTENIKMAYYYVFGWGFPVLPVFITFFIKPNSYGNSEVCWLSTEDGTIWAFTGPVVSIIAVNTFVLIMVIRTVVSTASTVKSSDHAHVKAGIKGLFVLMPLLGVGWILGLFALNDGTKVFIYAFAVVNGFQGLLIFLLHCVFNSEVRQAFRRQKEKHSLTKENLSQYDASFSLSQSDSGSKKTSNSSSFGKLKGKLSFKRKSSARVAQVQPTNDKHDVTDSSFQVKRTFHESSRLSMTGEENKMSYLNCPMDSEREILPNNQQAATEKRKRSRPY